MAGAQEPGITIQGAISAMVDFLKTFERVAPSRVKAGISNGATWLEFVEIRELGTDEHWDESAFCKLWDRPIQSPDQPITYQVLIVELFDGDPSPQDTQLGGITAVTRPLPFALLALVPTANGPIALPCTIMRGEP